MKKQFLSCLIGLTAITCSLMPIKRDVLAANPADNSAETAKYGTLTAFILPVKAPSSVQLTYVNLAEREKWILDEVLSDYVSEHVVMLHESGRDYTIGDWIDREAYTCLFLEAELSEGHRYLVCGYAKAGGGYVYFELSSSAPLTEQQVREKMEQSFARPQRFQSGVC